MVRYGKFGRNMEKFTENYQGIRINFDFKVHLSNLFFKLSVAPLITLCKTCIEGDSWRGIHQIPC